jgi:hypothetical protein
MTGGKGQKDNHEPSASQMLKGTMQQVASVEDRRKDGKGCVAIYFWAGMLGFFSLPLVALEWRNTPSLIIASPRFHGDKLQPESKKP